MEQYIKTKPVKFICNLFSWNITIWIALLILSIQYTNKNWPVVIGLAIYELIYSLTKYLVLRAFYNNGKCTGIIKAWSFLRFLVFCLILAVHLFFIVYNSYQLFIAKEISLQSNDPLFRYFTLTGIISIIILIISYLFTTFVPLRTLQYYYWLYKTFSHIQIEQKNNQIEPLKFKKYRLPERAETVSVLILLCIIVFTLIFVFTVISRVPLAFQRTHVISIGLFGYLGYLITSPAVILFVLITMYLEVWNVKKSALLFAEVHRTGPAEIADEAQAQATALKQRDSAELKERKSK